MLFLCAVQTCTYKCYIIGRCFLLSDISVVNASLSRIIVAKDITHFHVWVPDSRGKLATLHLRQISDMREGQFVHPAEMTLHVVGECISECNKLY